MGLGYLVFDVVLGHTRLDKGDYKFSAGCGFYQSCERLLKSSTDCFEDLFREIFMSPTSISSNINTYLDGFWAGTDIPYTASPLLPRPRS